MKTKIENKSKQTTQSWDPSVLSYGWWKQQIQIALAFKGIWIQWIFLVSYEVHFLHCIWLHLEKEKEKKNSKER